MKILFKALTLSFALFITDLFPKTISPELSIQNHSFNNIFYNLDKYLSEELEQKEISKKKGTTLTEKEASEIKKVVTKKRSAIERLYQIMAKTDKAFHCCDPVEVGVDSWRHIRLLSGDPETPDKNIWKKIDRTKTLFGQAVLGKMLCHPTKNLEEIKSRQLLLKSLTLSPELFDKFDSVISKVKSKQKCIMEIIGTDPTQDYQNLLHESYGVYWGKVDEFFDEKTPAPKDFWQAVKKANKDLRHSMDSSSAVMNFSVFQASLMKYISTRCFADNIVQNLEWVFNPRYLGPLRKIKSSASFEDEKIENLKKDLKKHKSLIQRAVEGEFDKLNEEEIGKIGNVLYQLFEATNAQNVNKSTSLINPIQNKIFWGEWVNIVDHAKKEGKSLKDLWKLTNMFNAFAGQRILLPCLVSTTRLYNNIKYSALGLRDWIVAIKKSFSQTGAIRELLDQHKHLVFLAEQMGPGCQKALFMLKNSEKSLEGQLGQDLAWLEKNLSTSLQSPGNFLKAYKMVYQLKSKLAFVFAAIGQVDAYLSMARLKLELNKKRNGLCFAEFETNPELPAFNTKKCWELFLNPDIAKANTVKLGGGGIGANAVLTGPNAGGKSTFMRSVFMSALLAQTFGVAPAKELKLTPFSGLFSYMNVTDNPSKGKSLFQSEMELVVETFEKIKSISASGGLSLFIVDEMFSGTNPIDARAILQAICTKCCTIKQTAWVVSTHLPGAAKAVAESSNGIFKGLMVRETTTPAGKMIFDHKIVPGVSSKSTAMDVARVAKLEPEILEHAQAIKKQLTGA